MLKSEPIDVEVAGGVLRVLVHRPEGEPTLPPVLGLHGVTASAMSLQPVARAVVSETLIAAPDLRGRGASGQLPGPYGMEVHADDCAAVVRALGLDPVIVVGESMGAYVGVTFAAKYPELVKSFVLVDGGIPLPLPEGIPTDVLLNAALGPADGAARHDVPVGRRLLRLLAGASGGGRRLERRRRGLSALRPRRRGAGAPVTGLEGSGQGRLRGHAREPDRDRGCVGIVEMSDAVDPRDPGPAERARAVAT